MSTRQTPKRKPAIKEAIVNPSQLSDFWRSKSIDELAAEQGVGPIDNMDDLKGDFWPDDKTVDDFLPWLRDLRRGGSEKY